MRFIYPFLLIQSVVLSSNPVAEMTEDEMMAFALAQSLEAEQGGDVASAGPTNPADDELERVLKLSIEEVESGKSGQEYIPDPRPGRLGFHNLGNSCWLAAISQALLHIPRVLETLRSAPTGQANRVLDALRFIDDQIWNHYHTGEPLTPNGFLDALEGTRPGFHGDRMEDAYEVMQLILTELIAANANFGTLFEVESTITRFCSDCGLFKVLNPKEFDVILPISEPKEGSESVKLEDCIYDFTVPEVLGGVLCDDGGCGQLHDANKWTTISSTGELLMISLRRFDAAMDKIKTKVEYPLELDLGFLNQAGIGRYRLQSVINHSGETRSSGHYTVDFFHPGDNEWVHANDRSVIAKDPTLVSETAYIFIYERV
jgi:ubiquitin C-terminal hydrolase